MTTVVYKDGILASDGLVVEGSRVLYTDYEKSTLIITHLDQYLVGFAGTLSWLEVFHEWVKLDMNPDCVPDVPENSEDVSLFEAVVVPRSGDGAFLFENFKKIAIGQRPACLGSGADIALAGLLSGMTVVEAIELASKVDIYTNNNIQTVTFSPLYEINSY